MNIKACVLLATAVIFQSACGLPFGGSCPDARYSGEDLSSGVRVEVHITSGDSASDDSCHVFYDNVTLISPGGRTYKNISEANYFSPEDSSKIAALFSGIEAPMEPFYVWVTTGTNEAFSNPDDAFDADEKTLILTFGQTYSASDQTKQIQLTRD